MASTDKQLQYIVVTDFSPGIWADASSLGGVSIGSEIPRTIQAAPNGAAQMNGTFGCCANSSGALIGGPFTDTTHMTLPESGSSLDPPWDSNHVFDNARIIGFRNISPIYKPGTPGQLSFFPEQPTIMYQYYYDPTGANHNYDLRMRTRTYKAFLQPSTDRHHITNTSLANATLIFENDAVAYNSTATDNRPVLYGSGGLDLTRANVAAPGTAGNPTLVGCYFPNYLMGFGGGFNGQTMAYPKNSTSNVDSTESLGFTTIGNGSIGSIFAHQDRVVGLTGFRGSIKQAQFGTSGVADPSDYMEFLNPNDYSISSGTLVVNSENPSGYGSWGSMNASTLVLIKKQQGAVVISGPLEQPTVTKMPGVQGTGTHSSIGCVGPNGTFAYGTDNGVYGWSGGDSAQLLSPQLTGAFWINAADFALNPIHGAIGRFASTDKFLFAPNNWFMNWQQQSWWRLYSPVTSGFAPQYMSWWDNSASGMVVGAANQSCTVDGAPTLTMMWFDPTAPMTDWQWQSQPFAEGINRELMIREINLTYTGGPFTVTVTGGPQTPLTQNETFPANPSSSTPKTLSKPTTMQAWDASVAIECVGTGAVYRISLGYYEEEMAR